MENPKTPMQAMRDRKKESGLERLEVWIRPEWKDMIREWVKFLNQWSRDA